MTIGLFYGIILASNGGFRFNIGLEWLTKIRKALLMQCFFDFEGSFRYENPASCKQGSHFYSLGAACPERSEDFDLPYGSPLPAYGEHLGICGFFFAKKVGAQLEKELRAFVFFL